MSDDAPERTCPKCGGGNLEYAGGTVTHFKGRRIVETLYRCRDCGHGFTETAESEDQWSFPTD